MKTIWKYEIPITDEFELILPLHAKVLAVNTQQGVPFVWVLVDDGNETFGRDFILRGTGHIIAKELRTKYVGTFLIHEDRLVYHLFEVLE